MYIFSFFVNFRKSKGLFQAAIIQSGPIDLPGLKMDESKSMIDIHKSFATHLGCSQNDVVECLKRKSVKEIVSNYGHFDHCNGMLFLEFYRNPPSTLLYIRVTLKIKDQEFY